MTKSIRISQVWREFFFLFTIFFSITLTYTLSLLINEYQFPEKILTQLTRNEIWNTRNFFFSIKNIKTSSTLVSKNKQLYNK